VTTDRVFDFDPLEPGDVADPGPGLALLAEKLDLELHAHAQACVRCGLCATSCHYYLRDRCPDNIPGRKIELLRRVLAQHFPRRGWSGLLQRKMSLDAHGLTALIDSVFGRCTGCGRCSLHCSIGLDLADLIRKTRGMLVRLRLVPIGLQSTINLHLRSGNNMGIAREDWVDTLDWIGEEVAADLGLDEFRMPLDQEGAEILYVVNPREPKFFPLSLAAMAKVFHLAGASWTFGSNHFDATNYAQYSGDDEAGRALGERVLVEARRLGCRVVAVSECGHGYRTLRWELANWVGAPLHVEVVSVVELMARYLREDRIRPRPAATDDVHTLHDPCNLVRHSGIVEPQRHVLRASVTRFVEMVPNGLDNFCCGGGGGMLAMTEYAKRRLSAGGRKAEQIRETGASVVAVPCHNCIDQLTELSKHYELGVKVRTVGEVLADALEGPPGGESNV
jgi:Fe-S oxidoreductase